MIIFKESEDASYIGRTKENASADVTIAFAVDFTTAGEVLTKKSVKEQGKIYIPIDANSLDVTQERVDKIVERLNKCEAKNINIAGNGLYTLYKLNNSYTQQMIDDFVYELLLRVVNHPQLKHPIRLIRSGGQTGFDEAGAKAGEKLNITTLVLAPKGWKFRGVNTKDLSDEKLFKERFVINTLDEKK